MKTKLCLLGRVTLLAVLSTIPLFSQGDRGTITGTVTDATGAAVPGANVTVVQKGTNSSYRVVTTSSGDFTLPALAGGAYQVRVEKEGFKVYIADNVEVVPGGTASMHVGLEVGTAQQSVEVSASAQMVQTENAKVSTTVPEVLVDDLPVLVNGASRSPFDIGSTVPEVNTGGGGYQIAGGGNNLGVTLDGTSMTGDKIGSDVGAGSASAMFSPSVEALTEFNVEAGAATADMGHAAGGTISFVSKSGANDFHGSAFEFLRNQDLDARGFFATTKSVYKQNNFGVTAGGPVWIPKLYHGRNKTFFFTSYEGFRNRVGANNGTYYSVPTPEMWTGNFSNWVDGNNKLYTIYDPSTQVLLSNGTYQRTPFPSNTIPKANIDSVAAPIANYLSTLIAPNRPNVALTPGTSAYVRQNYVSGGTTLNPSNRWSAKIDQNLGTKHHLSYLMNRYSDASAVGADGPVGMPYPIGGDVGFNHAQVYRGNWDFTISPTLVNRFYGGFNHFLEDHGSMSRETDQSLAKGSSLLAAGYWKAKGICIPGYPECSAFPPISTGDFTGWGDTGTNGSDREIFELHEDMTKTKGSHTIQWGYFFDDSHYDGFGVQNISGTTGFNWDNTSQAGATSQAAGGGSGLASFLLGQVNSYSLDTVRYVTLVYRTHQAYIQDNWKATRKLTVNIGVRVDMNLAPDNGDGRLSDLSLSVANPAAGGIPGGIVFSGSGPGRVGSKSLIPNWYGKEPRLGFAWALNSKTTVRGSATRSFGPLNGTNGSSHFLGFVVHETLNDQSGGIHPLWVLKNGVTPYNPPPDIDAGCCNGQNPPYWEGLNGNKPPGLLNYSFNVQRQVTSTSVLEVDYLATLASHLPSNFLALNQVPYRSLPASLSPFTTAGRAALGSLMGSTLANAAGATPPWTCGAGSAAECVSFNSQWGTAASVTQAERPFPQFGSVDTLSGGGDRAGHSTYHSVAAKYNKRLGGGLTMQLSYRFSKLLGDADATNGDQYDRRLLKSIMGADQTHVVLFTYAYQLPFGKGKALLSNGGVAGAVLGGWRISGIQSYASGTPLSLGSPITFPIGEFSNRAQITTYDGWGGAWTGKFDPNAELYLQPQSFFPTQTINSFGNETRYNPKMRNWPSFNENESVARSFGFKEKAHLEFRLEGFNVLNRTAFGPLGGATTLTNANWGKWGSQANSARRMQVVARLTW